MEAWHTVLFTPRENADRTMPGEECGVSSSTTRYAEVRQRLPGSQPNRSISVTVRLAVETEAPVHPELFADCPMIAGRSFFWTTKLREICLVVQLQKALRSVFLPNLVMSSMGVS